MNTVDQADQNLSLLSSISKFPVAGQTLPMLVGTNHSFSSVANLGISRQSTNNPMPYFFKDSESAFASQLNHDYSSAFEAALTKMLLLQQAAPMLERQQSPQSWTQTLTLPTTPASAFPVIPAHNSPLLATIDQVNMKTCYRCVHCGLTDPDKFALYMHVAREHSGMMNLPVPSNLYSLSHQFCSDGGILDRFNMETSHLTSQNGNVWAPQSDFGGLASSLLRAPDNRACQKKAKCASISDSVVSASPSDLVRCELCGKYLSRTKPLSSLLNHAKRHNVLKQFICTSCPYGSSEAAHVRNHMKLRHRIVGRDPLDNRNPMLQDAWMRITVRCFPTMDRELSRFRFKNFRKKTQSANLVVSMTTEDDENSSRSLSSMDNEANFGTE